MDEKIEEVKETEVKIPRWREKLGTRYPERKFEKDEDYDGVLDDFMDGIEANEKSFKEANDKMIELMRLNPELASVIDAMLKDGVPFRVALASHYSPEELTAQEGDDDYESWKGKADERRKHLEEQDGVLKELLANEEASMAVIEEFCKAKGMNDEQREDFLNKCDEEIAAVVRKKVSSKFLETMWKGIHADELAASAASEAEVKTRNQKIEAKRMEEKKKENGDGVPVPVQTGGENKEKKGNGFLDDVISKRNFV